MNTHNLRLDFIRDWHQHVVAELARLGYAVDATESIEALTYKYYNVARRRILSQPRQIFEARVFVCPQQHGGGYAALKAKIIAGDDINPNLSKRLLSAEYEDLLLNDWGIHHFHLGDTKVRGFVERTGPLLFAYVAQDAVYCIAVRDHQAFSEKALLAILHENWPDVLARFRMRGVISVDVEYTDAERAVLRNAGIQTLVQVVPGVVYYAPGGGYTSAGTSLAAQMWTNRRLREIHFLEEYVRVHLDQFLDDIGAAGRAPSDPPTFSLVVLDDHLYVKEDKSQVGWPFKP